MQYHVSFLLQAVSPSHPLPCSFIHNNSHTSRTLCSSFISPLPRAPSQYLQPMHASHSPPTLAPLAAASSSPHQPQHQRRRRARLSNAALATESGLLEAESGADPQGARALSAADSDSATYDTHDSFHPRSEALEEAIRRDANVQVGLRGFFCTFLLVSCTETAVVHTTRSLYFVQINIHFLTPGVPHRCTWCSGTPVTLPRQSGSSRSSSKWWMSCLRYALCCMT